MRTKLSVNLTSIERDARIVVGVLAVTGGVLLLVGAESVIARVLEVLLILVGLDLIVTGATGHCPLYQRLGHVPASLRSAK
ncbi:DUF2892 domain-containing protein [Cellulomonas sp. P24]|jgi:hypothetical protein|uniref:Inner membrane protein YgaP-like transmembrane domain-containing protein n=1 Tax=mine drainage metagenome TaxID=410659 RepID=A0A1J5QLP5_9ZZZZ|nr:DUF2892 domain-containing protein [Cellulomonas sp. P24]MCR6492073.1 DUF2892 domain-containing protein [Cellulomonas sp. P24]